MKSVLISIQPYYVFLIIARLMGWNIPQEKMEEVRKDFPKDIAWNKRVHIYCSKNRRSFNRIPKQYQPFMEKLLGKVIGGFVCDSIRKGGADNLIQAYYHNNHAETCLTDVELVLYANQGKPLYFWHISALKIYDKPKELGEFKKNDWFCDNCKHISLPQSREPLSECDRYCDKYKEDLIFCDWFNRCEKCFYENCIITRPPQSWCYVEEL